jgi:hypothetical protein
LLLGSVVRKNQNGFCLETMVVILLANSTLHGLVQPLEALENKVAYFLERFPEYRKTLRLAVTHEEAGREARTYQGWQWHDVETHPTKLIRLVTEGISKISLRTRQATTYILRDRETIKRVLSRN